jgi:hypothetical protein
MMDISKPNEARRYVAQWGPRLLGKDTTFVETSSGRSIYFDNMTDEDAVWVARQLYEMELMGKAPRSRAQ